MKDGLLLVDGLQKGQAMGIFVQGDDFDTSFALS
jgi:hypothetical protein